MATRSLLFSNLTDDEFAHLNKVFDEMVWNRAGGPVGASIGGTPDRTAQAESAAAEMFHQSTGNPNDYGHHHAAPPSPPAPVVNQQPQSAMDRTVEIDAIGVPYNPELHTEKRTKTAKGEWRTKKGVDKDAVKAWREKHKRAGGSLPDQYPNTQENAPQRTAHVQPTATELNQQYGAPPVAHHSYQQPAAPQAYQQPAPQAYQQPAAQAYQQPAAPQVPPPPQPMQVPGYEAWFALFSELCNSGRLTRELLDSMNEQCGAQDADHYRNNDQARAMSYQYMNTLKFGPQSYGQLAA